MHNIPYFWYWAITRPWFHLAIIKRELYSTSPPLEPGLAGIMPQCLQAHLAQTTRKWTHSLLTLCLHSKILLLLLFLGRENLFSTVFFSNFISLSVPLTDGHLLLNQQSGLVWHDILCYHSYISAAKSRKCSTPSFSPCWCTTYNSPSPPIRRFAHVQIILYQIKFSVTTSSLVTGAAGVHPSRLGVQLES